MASLLDTYPEPDDRPMTFALPDETLSYSERLKKAADYIPTTTPMGLAAKIGAKIGIDLIERPGDFAEMFGTAERQTRLVDTMFSQEQAREEAYDRRIKAVREATGVELVNPERYRMTEREMRAATRDGPIDPAAYRRQKFETELAAVREKFADKAEALAFGDIEQETKAISQGAEADYDKARQDSGLSLPSSLGIQLAGGMWGQRRDPIMVGSLFIGPTTAVGRTVAARIASSAITQGLYNAGITALEQPVVQAWRAEIGVRSGVVPAMENIGLAFVFGAIPGAVFRGAGEISAAARPAVRRVVDGVPQAGDIDVAMTAAKTALGADVDLPPGAQGAIRLGEAMDADARATQPPPAKDIAPDLRDDLIVSAERYGDDPVGQPSPAAVAFVDAAQNRPVSISLRVTEDFTDPQTGARNLVFMGKDETGADRVHALVSVDGNVATIDDVRALDASGREMNEDSARNILGPRMMRSILQQFRDTFPEVERFVADRVSGARAGGRYDIMKGQEIEVPLRPVKDDIENEIADRVAAAQPQNQREAQMAASEALEDIGNRQVIARTMDDLARDRLPAPAPLPEGVKPPPASSKDPLDKIPIAREDGTPTLVSARQAARAGERETQFADLIRECK